MSVELWQEFALPGAIAEFRFTAHSDRGSVRRINEDSFLASAPLFLVADGMGGHSFGDRASQVAVATFAEAVDEARPARPQQILDAIRSANDAVVSLTDGSGPARTISGTTLAGVAFVDVGNNDNYHWMAFNVGDSRIYTWDGRRLGQLSVDHSAVQELVDLGQITKSQAETHPDRNIVTRALGADREVDPDIWLVPARAHQTFLLCSDGLTKELGDDEIARIIVFHEAEEARRTDGLPITLAERLVNAAVAAGGADNVTVVVVESTLAGSGVAASGEETVDRAGTSGILEETHPRG